MNARRAVVVAGLAVSVFAALGIVTTAQAGAKKSGVTWNVRVSESRGPYRTVSSPPLGKTVSSEIVGGPINGSDNAWLIYTRMPAGAHGPALFTLKVDHLYLVLAGKMTIQIGTDKFVAGPNTGITIPPGVPHEAWNAEAEPEAHIEVIAPTPSRDLMSMLTPAHPTKVDKAASFIHTAPKLTDLKPGLNGQQLASRTLTGAHEQMRIDNTSPGQGGPALHLHKFEQVYFVKEGTMTLQYGLETYKVPVNSFVIIPPGVIHTNRNETSAVERHAVWLLPEPEANSGPADVQVELKPPAPAGRQ